MASSKLYLLPIVTFILFIVTFIITFIIAVCMGHVTAVFPYISDTGTFSPESCIFGQLMNFGTLMLACVCYIRWRQSSHLCTTYGLGAKINCINKIAAYMGCASSLGINFVANFQETRIFWVHIIAAGIGFGCGVMYLILQTALSYKLYPLASNKRWLLYLRCVITVFVTILCATCMICGSVAFFQYKGNPKDMPNWQKEDGGWEFHIISVITEWITAFLIMSFILTFSGEFRRIHLSSPKIEVEPADFQSSVIEDGETVRWPA